MPKKYKFFFVLKDILYFLRCETILSKKFREKFKISQNNLHRTPPQTYKFVFVQGYLLESNFKFGENYFLPKKNASKTKCRKKYVFFKYEINST